MHPSTAPPRISRSSRRRARSCCVRAGRMCSTRRSRNLRRSGRPSICRRCRIPVITIRSGAKASTSVIEVPGTPSGLLPHPVLNFAGAACRALRRGAGPDDVGPLAAHLNLVLLSLASARDGWRCYSPEVGLESARGLVHRHLGPHCSWNTLLAYRLDLPIALALMCAALVDAETPSANIGAARPACCMSFRAGASAARSASCAELIQRCPADRASPNCSCCQRQRWRLLIGSICVRHQVRIRYRQPVAAARPDDSRDRQAVPRPNVTTWCTPGCSWPTPLAWRPADWPARRA